MPERETKMKMSSDSDHEVMVSAAQAWSEIKGASQQLWPMWVTKIGPALAKARAEAMVLAKTNQPKGKGYNGNMSALLIEYKLNDIEQVTRADLLNIMERLDLVESWRDRQRQPESLNHPSVVWRQFKSSKDWKEAQVALGLEEDTPRAPKVKTKTDSGLSTDELANENPLAAKEIEVNDLRAKLDKANAKLKAARTEGIDRSVEAYERLPVSPELDLSTAEGRKKAIDSIVVALAPYDNELSLEFIRELHARFEQPEVQDNDRHSTAADRSRHHTDCPDH
jgi:hypothetical protein